MNKSGGKLKNSLTRTAFCDSLTRLTVSLAQGPTFQPESRHTDIKKDERKSYDYQRRKEIKRIYRLNNTEKVREEEETKPKADEEKTNQIFSTYCFTLLLCVYLCFLLLELVHTHILK